MKQCKNSLLLIPSVSNLIVVRVKLCAWVRLKSIVVTYVYPRMKFGLFPVLLTTCQTSSIFLLLHEEKTFLNIKVYSECFPIDDEEILSTKEATVEKTNCLVHLLDAKGKKLPCELRFSGKWCCAST